MTDNTIASQHPISQELWDELMACQKQGEALQQFAEKAMTTGQAMQASLNERVRNVWEKIAATGVDVQNYNWAPDRKESKIHLVGFNRQ